MTSPLVCFGVCDRTGASLQKAKKNHHHRRLIAAKAHCSLSSPLFFTTTLEQQLYSATCFPPEMSHNESSAALLDEAVPPPPGPLSFTASGTVLHCGESVVDAKYKVVFVGDSSSGKSSIITRFMHDYFEPNYQATIGIDFLSKIMKLSDGRSVRLQLWDTAGQERFKSLIPSYIRGADAAMVVYDISSYASFEHTARWIDDIRQERADAVICLVGNKTDLGNSLRQVSTEEAEAHAQKYGVMFLECSAKAGYNVKKLFAKLANAMPKANNNGGGPQHLPATREDSYSSHSGTSSGRIRLQPVASLTNVISEQAKSCGC